MLPSRNSMPGMLVSRLRCPACNERLSVFRLDLFRCPHCRTAVTYTPRAIAYVLTTVAVLALPLFYFIYVATLHGPFVTAAVLGFGSVAIAYIAGWMMNVIGELRVNDDPQRHWQMRELRALEPSFMAIVAILLLLQGVTLFALAGHRMRQPQARTALYERVSNVGQAMLLLGVVQVGVALFRSRR